MNRGRRRTRLSLTSTKARREVAREEHAREEAYVRLGEPPRASAPEGRQHARGTQSTPQTPATLGAVPPDLEELPAIRAKDPRAAKIANRQT